MPPVVAVCGDGFRTGAEQCDDGNTQNGDACSSNCLPTAELLAPRTPSTSALPLPGRDLGGARHPLAAGCNTVGVTFVDHGTGPATLKLATFTSLGAPLKVVPFGKANIDAVGPAVAALGDDTFAVAWTDFEGDGDELGVRLRRVDPAATILAAPIFANSNAAYSQRAPDVIFDGRELVVAWVDDSDPVNGPDLRYRTFDASLNPLSDDLTLAASVAVEDHVSLAAFNGTWAAAWRSSSAGKETLEIQSGASHWTIGPYLPGSDDDVPALAFVDATHLAVAFTAGTDPGVTGTANTPRLHAAVLDAAYPGPTQSFAVTPLVAPYATTPTLSQTKPALVAFADRLLVAWRSSTVIGSPLEDELWKREVKWSINTMGQLIIDTSSPEVQLPDATIRNGDQSSPTLLSSPFWPEHRVFSAYEDWGQGFGAPSGMPDIGLQVSSIPDPLCDAVSFVTSTDGPVAAWIPVSITATAQCWGGATASYRFAIAPTDTSNYTYLSSGWIPGNSAGWQTTGVAPGDYDIVVWVRANGSTRPYEAVAKKTINVRSKCTGFALNVSPPVGGTVLTLTPSANCADPEYTYYYRPLFTGSWIPMETPWLTTPYTFDMSSLPFGRYEFFVITRELTWGNGDGASGAAYQIGPACSRLQSFTVSPTGPKPAGTQFTVDATPACDSGVTPEYDFVYLPPGAPTFIPFPSTTDWQTQGHSVLNTTGFTPGTYGMQVRVRGQGHVGFGEVWAGANVVIQ